MSELTPKKQQTLSKNFGLTLITSNNLTPVIASKSDQISKIKKEQGEQAVHALISKLLLELCDYVKIEATEPVIIKWAYKLMIKYWYFKTAEFTLAIEMGINGDFGKIYGAVNYSNLIEWFDSYEQIKTDGSISNATNFREHVDANDRSSLQGIKKLISNSDFQEKYNK